AELCGKDHGFMPIVVHVLPQDKYDAWVAEQKQKATAAATPVASEAPASEPVSASNKPAS
ncbi:MAG TPA: cytochrome c oxidase subunit II, partial [Rhodocyclaceae bacterium]|nr:cytochrome c oxidase subunit II [Rhodocyclaceae bacterium]